MSETSAKTAPVDLPLRLVYTAALLALKVGDGVSYEELSDAASKTKIDSPAAIEWLGTMQLGQEDRIIPFERSALDLLLAGSMLERNKLQVLHLYSEQAIGELGFYALSHSFGATWVDRYPTVDSSNGVGKIILEGDQISLLIDTLVTMGTEPLVASVSQDDDSLIDFSANWLGEMNLPLDELILDACLITAKDAQFVALNQNHLSSTVRRQRKKRATPLGRFSLRKASPSQWRVLAPPERMMEIHAASAEGRFLYLENERSVRLLLRLPDFLDSDPQPVVAYVDPVELFGRHLGAPCLAHCPVEHSPLVELTRRYHWLAPTDPIQWCDLKSSEAN
jgi:hypothetical protein